MQCYCGQLLQESLFLQTTSRYSTINFYLIIIIIDTVLLSFGIRVEIVKEVPKRTRTEESCTSRMRRGKDKRGTEGVGNPRVEALSRAEITGTYIMQCFFYESTTNR